MNSQITETVEPETPKAVRSTAIVRRIEVAIQPTPLEIALAWCSMDADEQAEFFECVAKISKTWKSPLCMQLQYVQDSPKLTAEGSTVMRQIGSYA